MRPGGFIWDVRSVQETDGQLIASRGGSPRVHMPLDRTGLFIEFVETPDFRAFAERFGMLHGTAEPELITDWQRAQQDMKIAVNEIVKGMVTDDTLQSVEYFLRGNISLEFKPGTQALVLMPKDLHSAMWLQLALAIHEKKQFRHCAWCARPFHAKGQQINLERVFCSNSCRQHDYRYRKNRETTQQD